MPVALAKLTPPRVGRVVPRERLYRSLDAALDASAVWVGAPAGSGKTTAIADYLTRRKTPLVWYRVDAGDLDLAAFFHSLAQSLSAKERRKPLAVFGPSTQSNRRLLRAASSARISRASPPGRCCSSTTCKRHPRPCCPT